MAGAALRAVGKHGNLAPMRRLLAIAGLLFVLTGCGGADDRAPFTESRIPPSLGPRFWAPEGWAWGLIGVGDAPVQRYGVSSTAGTPKANILILTGYGETAEVWFETARDLNARGYSVWVLERAGQAGSARYAGPRDLVHAPSFDDDVAATKLMARMLAAGGPDTPVVLLGHDVGGLVALRALQTGAPVKAAVIESLSLPDAPATPAWLMNLGVGRAPSGVGGWSRGGPDAFTRGLTLDRQRGAVQLAWQTANPDLRMDLPTLGWQAAAARTAKQTQDGAPAIKKPVLFVGVLGTPGGDRAEGLCRRIGGCQTAYIGDAGGKRVGPALHLESDQTRSEFLKAVTCAASGEIFDPERTCPE